MEPGVRVTRGVKHEGIVCDSCEQDPITGVRWKCSSCRDFDLCMECYMMGNHDMSHGFMRMDSPKARAYGVAPRSVHKPKPVRKVFEGATVMRGTGYGVKHEGVTCNACLQDPIIGVRWKCLLCYDFDLCTDCYMTENHDISHGFMGMDDSRYALTYSVAPRSVHKPKPARGVFEGATVMRGPDDGVKHEGIVCDSCEQDPITGVRWKCSSCRDFDLCMECYMMGNHDMSHGFMRIDSAKAHAYGVAPRSVHKPKPVRKVFEGATVMRGTGYGSILSKTNVPSSKEVADDTIGVKHEGFTCDMCTQDPIIGVRWKCSSCSDFDLCMECYMTGKHDMSHSFMRMDSPIALTLSKQVSKLTLQTPQKGMMLPTRWDYMDTSNTYMKVHLDTSNGLLNKEFQGVRKKFCKTLPHAKIVRIDRIQNKYMWEHFYIKRRQFEAVYGVGYSYELELFHGTHPESVDIICQDNLDPRLAGDRVGVLYGQGTYFATEAKYSDGYSQADSAGNKYMFQCRVLAGKWTVGDPSYKRPPQIDPRDSKSKLYDCCVDSTDNPRIFCLFDCNQYYPEYLIQYK